MTNTCEYELCVYLRSLDDDSFIFMLFYVDDMLIVASHLHDVNELKIILRKDSDMKDLGVAKKILYMKIQKKMSLENDVSLRKATLKRC